MKNLFLIAVIGLLASCGSHKQQSPSSKKNLPTLYWAGKDTTMIDSCMAFEKKSYKGTVCETGKTYNGTYWRPAGFNVDSHSFTKQGMRVPDDSITKWFGGNPTTSSQDSVLSKKKSTGSTASKSGFSWDWLWWILGLLAALAILALAIWLLREFVLWLMRNSSTPRTGAKTSRDKASPGKSSVSFMPGSERNFNKASGDAGTSVSGNTGYEGPIALVEQVQKTGGKVTFGDLSIEIPPKGVAININNTSGTISGAGIKIDVDADQSTHVTDGRQFSKTSAKQQEHSDASQK